MVNAFFMRWLAPGFANGIGLGLWVKLLTENRFRVELPYIGRAAAITASAALNSLGGFVEQLAYRRAIRRANVPPPLFVLGVPRSGTTHLHNLLSCDSRFSFPNTFQTMNPRVFLWTERWLAPLQQMFLPTRRPMDNVHWNVGTPAEDEFAIMGLSGLSPLASSLFPGNLGRYDKYFSFLEASEADRERWKQTLLYFLKKMHRKDGRPMILKSPMHTARIPMLLELFPGARFVLIHRHPFEVYPSSIRTTLAGLRASALQRWDMQALSRWIEVIYRLMFDSYFNDRRLIPGGQLVEIGFEQLERSPISTLRHVYEQLSLPSFAVAEPALAGYLSSIEGYRKNAYVELDSETKSRLAKEWQRSFQEWGYEP